MNDDQITALAREYAEWVTDVPKANELPNCLRDEANKVIADSAERMLTWLCDRFCLMEKDKVRGEYLLARADYRTSNDVPTVKEYHRGEMSAIDRLFPEIAKEVRNETD